MLYRRVNLGFFLVLGIILCFSLLGGCAFFTRSSQAYQTGKARQRLAMMSFVTGPNADRERNTLTPFAEKLGYQFRYLPVFAASTWIDSYQKLFRVRSPQPDLLEIDVIWPAILANDLLDLKQYLGHEAESFPAEALNAFTVDGRLVAVPVYIDNGLLYYRSDLLKKYGFAHPPETWDELEHMADVIQRGERDDGKKDFWGFVWPGGLYEGLTCNALEWFSSQGAGHIIEADHTVHVYNRNAIGALRRATSWVGTISPPGVISYTEDDNLNLFKSGHAAFMRGWAYAYDLIAPSRALQGRFSTASVPGGSSGKKRTLGGAGIAVSRYSEHREAAIATLRHLISSPTQTDRAKQASSILAQKLHQNDRSDAGSTRSHESLADQATTGMLVARPSMLVGNSYERVSHAYFEAVHSALMKQRTPEDALANLERQLVQITGFRAVRD